MTAGLPWTWESFPQYLDAVAARPHDVDVAAMVPHSALRVYVMGARAVRREEATPDDIAAMAALMRDALDAGAIGFGTSRALQQRSSSGEPIPTVRAAEDELAGILGAMRSAGTGVFQALSDFYEFSDIDGEFAMLRRLVAGSGRPMSFTVNQKHHLPDGWRRLLELTHDAVQDGVPMKAQVLGRPTGVMLGLDLTLNPLHRCRSYAALSGLPRAERIEALRRDEVRAAILAEMAGESPTQWRFRFELTDPPCYEPVPEDSIAARAERAGTTPAEVAYDVMLQRDGRGLIYQAFQNYAGWSLDACHEMLTHPDTILGLGDGGAHLGLVCDASYPTTMLSYWARDRVRGPRIGVPETVRALTSSTAEAVGLHDRGRIAAGWKADLNVIDFARLRERAPHVVNDLPGGGRRIVQHAEGYVAKIVSGVVTAREGEHTGALPGTVVRGAQPAPR